MSVCWFHASVLISEISWPEVIHSLNAQIKQLQSQLDAVCDVWTSPRNALQSERSEYRELDGTAVLPQLRQ